MLPPPPARTPPTRIGIDAWVGAWETSCSPREPTALRPIGSTPSAPEALATGRVRTRPSPTAVGSRGAAGRVLATRVGSPAPRVREAYLDIIVYSFQLFDLLSHNQSFYI
jgi:hypothetical protein